MPLYTLDCLHCGEVEVLSRRFVSFDVGFCPHCGNAARKKVDVAGLPPFKSYWSEALSKDPRRPVHVDSREREARLCRECDCARVS